MYTPTGYYFKVNSLKSHLLYITAIQTKYFKKNSKFNQMFHSLNVIEYRLRCQYISVNYTGLKLYSSVKPLFKDQGPVNLSLNTCYIQSVIFQPDFNKTVMRDNIFETLRYQDDAEIVVAKMSET